MNTTWKDVASLIPVGGELIKDVVGGPVGLLAEGAGNLLASALGVNATPDSVATALKTDPAAAEKLAEAQGNNQTTLQTAAMQQRIAMAQEQSKQIESDNATALGGAQVVNATMQKEDDTKKFSWRDFFGYVYSCFYAVIGLMVCFLVEEAVRNSHYEALNQIPAILGAFATLLGLGGLVLGVPQGIESHHAGMVDRINAEKPEPEAKPAGGAPMVA